MSITPPNQNQRIHAPFRYFGSKSRRLGFVLPFLPEKPGARVYPFGGGRHRAAAIRNKPILNHNDLNGDAVNLFKIVANPQKLSQLLELIFATPYSRAEFHRAFAVTSDPIEQARRFLIRQQQSFGGLGRSFGVQVNRDGRNSSNMTRWAHLGETLKIVHNRVRHWIFECRDFERVITFYDRPTTAFYCDPPYIPSTRSGGRHRAAAIRFSAALCSNIALSFPRIIKQCCNKRDGKANRCRPRLPAVRSPEMDAVYPAARRGFYWARKPTAYRSKKCPITAIITASKPEQIRIMHG